MSLLEIEDLRTWFHTDEGEARAVDGVSLRIEEGESVALVGESACGKSVTALSIMGLIRPPGHHPSGSIRFDGAEMLGADETTLRRMRGNQVSMIFQEPMSSLNPVYSVGNQLAEPLRLHQRMTAAQARRRGEELLGEMGIASPAVVLDSYPHQLSGGMCQRVMIAMAMACRPRLLIADEPSTALDVTVQAQILHLIRELQRETGMALLLITHDLGVVNQMSDRVCVMYSGHMVETAPREALLQDARHPYTVKLLESSPRGVSRQRALSVIRGQVQPATRYGEGCRFADRCDDVAERCRLSQPPLFPRPAGAQGRGASGMAAHSNGAASSEPGGASRSRGEVACFLDDPDTPLARRPALSPPTVAGPVAERPAAKQVQPHELPPVLLETRELTTHFPVRKGFFRKVIGYVRAVDGVSLAIREGATLGLVGESGCGKTTLGHSLLNLEGHALGEVLFEGKNLLTLSAADLRRERRKVQIIFQDPFASLNPRMTVQDIVGEGLRIHAPELSPEGRHARVAEALQEVGLSPTSGSRYAHEFSGGQRQRIAIARAIILRPRFIVLDEATSALDVSVQAQILNLLRELQARHNLTYLFITHDLGVVQYLAHQIAVMYLGRLVEYGPTEQVFNAPTHPYTSSLLAAVPSLETRWERPPALTGDVPSPYNPPQGCHFHPRCPLYLGRGADVVELTPGGMTYVMDEATRARCRGDYPEATVAEGGTEANGAAPHWSRCHALQPKRADLPPTASSLGERTGTG